MSRRRKAREIALQTLYAVEISGGDWKSILRENVERRRASEEAIDYAERIVEEVMARKPELDKAISSKLVNWDFSRVSIVDKTILRIALSELIACPEVPTSVILNEAIDIAREFSSADAGRFVNGLLDVLAKEVRGN